MKKLLLCIFIFTATQHGFATINQPVKPEDISLAAKTVELDIAINCMIRSKEEMNKAEELYQKNGAYGLEFQLALKRYNDCFKMAKNTGWIKSDIRAYKRAKEEETRKKMQSNNNN